MPLPVSLYMLAVALVLLLADASLTAVCAAVGLGTGIEVLRFLIGGLDDPMPGAEAHDGDR